MERSRVCRLSGCSGASKMLRAFSGRMLARYARYLIPLVALAAIVTAACGGGELSVANPEGGATLELKFPPERLEEHELPKISGGFLPYETSIQGCPEWVILFPDQGILAGTAPIEDQGKTFFCTYRVTEADPGFRPRKSVSYGLKLAVGSTGSLTLGQPDDISLFVGTFRSVPLDGAEGGIQPYKYEFTCAGGQLPSGMGFARETRIFAGTPDAAFRDSCTYTVTDSAELPQTVSKAVEVEAKSPDIPELTLGQPDDISLSVGTFRSVPLDGAEGGIQPYKYEFTCAGGQLPSGMGFARETRIFAGTPDAAFRDSCTYTVTDSAELPQTVSKAVEVEAKSPDIPELTLGQPDDISLSVGTFRSVPLDGAEGGIQPYKYEFTCAGGQLPSGMGFARETRIFAGTPDAAFRDSCTYTVTDSAELPQTVSKAVEVEAKSPDIPELTLGQPDDISLSVGTFRSVPLDGAEGGIQPYKYEFTCAGGQLPSGMGFARETRIFAGTPDAAFRDSCTYTVTDSAELPQTVSKAVEVEAKSPDIPELTLGQPDDISLSVGTFRSVPLDGAEGGIQPYKYEFTCAGGQLPSGMGFARETRIFAGTPDAAFRDSCTYTVTDSAELPQTVSKAVEVEAKSPDIPELTLGQPDDISLSVGTFRSVPLDGAEGGIQPYKYEFTCAGGQLPSGMGFARETRIFAGTPDAAFRDSCTYTVTDSAELPQTVSKAVEVEAKSPDIPELTLGQPDDISLSVGTFRSVPLDGAEGGIQPYKYEFTCAGGQLPSGMGFARETRIFAGTPDAAFRDSCTYTVTDSAELPQTVSKAVEVEAKSPDIPELTLGQPDDISLSVGTFRSVPLDGAEGGIQPYKYEFTCAGGQLPSGMGFARETRIFAGTPDAAFRDSCTYTVTDSADPAESLSRVVQVEVTPLDRGTWRFRTRSRPQSDHPVDRDVEGKQTIVTLPFAIGGAEEDQGTLVYELRDVQSPLGFDAGTRVLSYEHAGVDPIFDTPTTFRYEVYEDADDSEADDALCVDISYRDPPPREEDPSDGLLNTVRITVRDDASWNGTEFRCPDAAPRGASSSHAPVSNPVHTALGPVHARRAVDVAHAAIRDRVRDWSPGDSRGLTAIGPVVGLASLSGESGGFDYSGTSEALSAGAELGTGSWQAGLVATFVRTGLDYRAGSNLRERGYLAGEHDTEFLSLHPFAAWHAPSGGHLWASLGAGTGELNHRDDLGFQSWSRSNASLLSYTAGAAFPIAEWLSGELQAEAGIEAFSLEIEGGGSISSSLPTMRGRDYRAGLAWSAPLLGAPSISVAYKHLTGDGGDGGSLETEGSFSVAGFLDPRLSVTMSAEASIGLGDHDQDLWGLGVGLRFAPDGLRRGFGLEVDTRLLSLANERSQSVSIRGEAGYGLWGGLFFGTVRPYVGVIGDTNRQSVQPTLGLALRETPNSAAGVEFRERRDIDRALMFTLWLRP